MPTGKWVRTARSVSPPPSPVVFSVILEITINGKTHPAEVPEALLNEAEDFFRKLDRDMDHGCQMSRRWVDNPSVEQRCQFPGAGLFLFALVAGERVFCDIARVEFADGLNRLQAIGTGTDETHIVLISAELRQIGRAHV